MKFFVRFLILMVLFLALNAQEAVSTEKALLSGGKTTGQVKVMHIFCMIKQIALHLKMVVVI